MAGHISTRLGAYIVIKGQYGEGTCCCQPHLAMLPLCICLVLGPIGLVGLRDSHCSYTCNIQLFVCVCVCVCVCVEWCLF